MRWQTIVWSILTILVAGLVSFFVARIEMQKQPVHQHHHKGNSDFHQWLHENLKITAEQELQLRPRELAFERERMVLQKKIETAGKLLAEAIQFHQLDSTEVTSAHEALLAAQGELQRSTLQHFFLMKEGLTEEQGQKLLEWTHESLTHGYSH